MVVVSRAIATFLMMVHPLYEYVRINVCGIALLLEHRRVRGENVLRYSAAARDSAALFGKDCAGRKANLNAASLADASADGTVLAVAIGVVIDDDPAVVAIVMMVVIAGTNVGPVGGPH
jgi:hypothetical protein